MLVYIQEGTTLKHAADHVFLHYFYLLAELEKKILFQYDLKYLHF